MAELHIIGQILHASDFPKQNLFCKWSLQYGNNWRLISGSVEGQTQVDNSEFSDIVYWYFPIDIHLTTKGIQGWPKIQIQIFHLDWVGRAHLFGYGYLTIPTSPGLHKIDCYTWRPVCSLRQRIYQYFLGGAPQINNSDLLVSTTERYKLNTESMGVVHFEIGIIFKNFDKFGLEY